MLLPLGFQCQFTILGSHSLLRLHRLAGTWTTKGDFLNERYI
jgi:hypothetical protein